jgi:hypothetical protein
MIAPMCVKKQFLSLETVEMAQKNLMNSVTMAIQLLVMDVVIPVNSNEIMVLSVEMVLSKLENSVTMVISKMVTNVRVSVRTPLLILGLFLHSWLPYFSLSWVQDTLCTEKARLLHKYSS